MAAHGEQARDFLPAAGPAQAPFQLPPKTIEKVSEQQNLMLGHTQEKLGQPNQ